MKKKNPTKRWANANLKLWLRLTSMPPLNHWPKRDADFDFEKSEVIQHIMALKETNLRHAVSLMGQARKLSVIIFDPITKLWKGNKDWQL